MATAKVKAMENPVVLKEAKSIIQPDQVWTPAHQSSLLWNLFRTPVSEGGMLIQKPEEKAQAFKNWQSLYGLLSYPSNTARRLAEAKVCSMPLSSEVEFDVDDVK